jgi:hypothetical protein
MLNLILRRTKGVLSLLCIIGYSTLTAAQWDKIDSSESEIENFGPAQQEVEGYDRPYRSGQREREFRVEENLQEEGPDEGGPDEGGPDEGGPDEEAPEPGEKNEKKAKKKKNAEKNGADEEGADGEANKKEDEGWETRINEFVDFGGNLEVEASWLSDFDEHHHSDIVLESAEIEFEIKLIECARGYLCFEYEPRDEDFHDHEFVTVKEGFITLGATEFYPYFVRAGRMYLPFTISTGAVVGDTLSINDPLTIEIFEIREDAVMFGWEKNGWFAGIYAFNGDTNSGDGLSDHVEQYGGTIRYGYEFPERQFSIGFDYISNVFDSDNLFFEIGDIALFGARYAPGMALHMRYFNHGFHFIAEYAGAFRSSKFDFDGEDLDLAPKAWQIELGYITKICCRRSYAAVNFSQSFDLHGFFPKWRFLATLGSWIYEDVLLAIEYGHEKDYSRSSGGTGHSADSVFMQLAYEW